MKDLHIRLEMNPEDFAENRAIFLNDLATAANIDPSGISIVGLRVGCVIVVLRGSDEDLGAIVEAFRSRSRDRDDVFARFKVEAVRDELPVAMKSFTLTPKRDDVLSWLHLSDLHVGSDKTGVGSLDDWMKDLLRDLKQQLAAHKFAPRFILVSGDIAFSGAEAEYERALDFLGRVRKKLGSEIPLFAVPGNHDIQWSEIVPKREAQLRQKLESSGSDAVIDELAAETPAAKRLHSAVMKRHKNFSNFRSRLAEMVGLAPAERRFVSYVKYPSDGLTIGIALLNSALLSTRGDLLKELGSGTSVPIPPIDMSFLALGESQLREAYEALEDCNIRIAVLHHPPFTNWFSEEDLVHHRTWLPEFDFVHRGHEHVPSGELRTPVGVTSGMLELASGALHTRETWYRGFSAVRLDLSQGLVTTGYWAFGERVRRWHLDTLASESGVEERVIGPRLRGRLGI